MKMATNFSVELQKNLIITTATIATVLLLISSVTTARLLLLNANEVKTEVVQFASDIGGDSDPVKITCKADGFKEVDKILAAGHSFTFNPTRVNDIYYCIAIWRKYFASIQSFDPIRDAAHSSVFWKTDVKGLFFSYDGKSYDLFATWQTE